MHTPKLQARGGAMSAGVGATVFGLLTLVSTFAANAPGGSYSADAVARFTTKSHCVVVVVVFHLALLGVAGLLVSLVQLRERIGSMLGDSRLAGLVWGLGIAAAASFAAGWAIVGGEAVARLERGGSAAVPASVTYLLSEIGAVFIYGAGMILLGIALLAYAVRAAGTLPSWLRWSTGVAGVAGIAGLAFFPAFVFMLWWIVAGAWLIMTSRSDTAPAFSIEPGTSV